MGNSTRMPRPKRKVSSTRRRGSMTWHLDDPHRLLASVVNGCQLSVKPDAQSFLCDVSCAEHPDVGSAACSEFPPGSLACSVTSHMLQRWTTSACLIERLLAAPGHKLCGRGCGQREMNSQRAAGLGTRGS